METAPMTIEDLRTLRQIEQYCASVDGGSCSEESAKMFCQSVPCSAQPTAAKIARAANRDRQRLRPHDPTDLNFKLSMDSIPDDLLIGDIQVGNFRHLVFATSKQLELLSRAKTWYRYLDATIKISNDPFYQLFSVHAFIKSGASVKQIPLMFALMPRRKRKDYKKVFQCLKGNLPDCCMTQAVCDLDAGMWRGFREVLFGGKVQGCAFHWGQAVFRKVKSLGLEPAYRGDDGTHKLISKLLSLPMLPTSELHTRNVDAKQCVYLASSLSKYKVKFKVPSLSSTIQLKQLLPSHRKWPQYSNVLQ